MSGRSDSVTHAAAILKIHEATKYAGGIRAHLEEVVRGAAFKGSQRSQDFLRHVVECGLRGEFEELRERSIGIALFGKPPAYDTAEDAIVRVTASDVRRRLLQHYGKTGGNTDFRIDLPAGSYIPEFRCGVPAEPAAPPAPIAPVLAAPTDTPRKRAFPWRAVALIALVMQAATGTWWLAAGRRVAPPAKRNLIATAFQGTPGSIQVIVGDDGLLLIEVLLGRSVTLEEYENLKYLRPPDVVKKKGLEKFWDSLAARQVTNLGNLQNAARLAEDMGIGRWSVSIRHARQVNPRDFRNGNFVILGSSRSNPWASLFQPQNANFVFENAPAGKWATIRNLHPRTGEPAIYELHEDPATKQTLSYAQVSLLENNARTGRVLLVAGQSASATEMAGAFLLRADAIGQTLRMLGRPENGALPDLEMVLRITEVNEVGNSVALVACRMLAGRTD